ncbi:MAG: OmpA family protein, partial [Acidobacteriota bacterium]
GIDQCPGTPAGQKIDREGCPRVRLDKDEPQILKNVRFWRGAELYPGADAWIALLLEALEYWPDLTIELGVYTDSSGTPEGNRTIARRRGEVLKEWLVQHGVAPRRLEIKAYGAVDFIADNETEEGREANRRVEVKRLSGDLRKHPKPRPEPAAEEEGAPAEPEGGAEEPAPESTPEEAPGGGPPEKPGA